MTVLPSGSINSSALTVPDLYVQIQSPQQVLINGAPTNIVGVIGTASWGPVNSPTPVGSVSSYLQNFGPILTNTYDMGTHVAVMTQQFASNLLCVRVSDGTDVAASSSIVDTVMSASIPGSLLTALYTGTVGNTLAANISVGTSSTTAAPTYKLSLALPNSVPEIYDNIGGTGAVFWQNLVNAVNLGINGLRGPSQLCVASLGNGVGGVSVTTAGSYTTIPTLSFSSGAATATALMGGLVPTAIAGGGSGYAVNDTITLAGGTNSTPCILKVATVSSGAVATVTVQQAGSYSALPSNPVSQASTSGSGSGATFTMAWGIIGANITNAGSYPSAAPTITVSTGTGALTPLIGSQNPPKVQAYSFTGGTNGISGVTGSTLLGQDTAPRKGMYALRSSGASIVDLCDVTDPTTFSAQISYGLGEGSYMIAAGPAGQSVATAAAVLSTQAVDSYALKYMMGDWVYWNDVYNSQVRLISPQGFVAGLLSSQSPANSSLNQPVYGVVATQKSQANQVYSSSDLQTLVAGRVDLICSPVPGGKYMGVRFGRNSSSNPVIHGDNYTRMTNFLAYSMNGVMGIYVGQLQTPSEQLSAQNALQSFLSNLQSQGLIGTSNGAPAFQVTINSTNNPPSQVALGYQRADVLVTYLSLVEYFVINFQGGQSVQVASTQVTPL